MILSIHLIAKHISFDQLKYYLSLERALEEGGRSGQAKKLNANKEALLISLVCSTSPEGCCKWTLQEKATINWMFNVDDFRSKLNRAYDKLLGQD